MLGSSFRRWRYAPMKIASIRNGSRHEHPPSPILSSPEFSCSVPREDEDHISIPTANGPYSATQFKPRPPWRLPALPHDSGLSSLTRFSHVRSIDFDGFPQACHSQSRFDAKTPTNHPPRPQRATYRYRGLHFTDTHLSDAFFFIFVGIQAAPRSR